MVYTATIVAILASVSYASHFTFPPTGAGYVDTAAPAKVLPFVDYVYTNARENPCYVTASNNAGVRILERYLDIWELTSTIVDAGVTLPSSGSCPAVVSSSWTGIPGHSTDRRVLLAAVHNHNLQYWLLGPCPLTAIGINLTGTTTTVTSMPEIVMTVSFSDAGINVGLLADANPKFGLATNFASSMDACGSTEPPKRFFHSKPLPPTEASLLATLLKPSVTGWQEMVSHAAELGHSRIMSAYHSPLDGMGGAGHATSIAAAKILANIKANTSAPAFQQAQAQLSAAAGSPLMEFAHLGNASTDRFADHNANKALFKFRLTYGLDQIGAKGVPAVVPKVAEVLWETRLPYITSDQTRLVLKSNAVDSGYPLLDNSAGWGRPNLFDAADVYGRFDGDVNMTLDGILGGFNAVDS
ncbi:hypothetical protein HDU77_004730 [Chytriomyces hyalinus]|nr:hypothetical protein HDU77_004730 [Chytriomyces hyalinus]